MIRLAPGLRDLDHLRRAVEPARRAGARAAISTRNHPRRAAELLDGGSLFWVVGGQIVGRSRILAIEAEDGLDNGSIRRTRIEIEADVVAVSPRPRKAFQGWRYLDPSEAPPDLDALAATGGSAEMPDDMRRQLAAMGLL